MCLLCSYHLGVAFHSTDWECRNHQNSSGAQTRQHVAQSNVQWKKVLEETSMWKWHILVSRFNCQSFTDKINQLPAVIKVPLIHFSCHQFNFIPINWKAEWRIALSDMWKESITSGCTYVVFLYNAIGITLAYFMDLKLMKFLPEVTGLDMPCELGQVYLYLACFTTTAFLFLSFFFLI